MPHQKVQPLRILLPSVAMLLIASTFQAVSAHAQEDVKHNSSSTGLPLPRFASLKSDKVNVRQGPSKDHRINWVFRKISLPVEIIAEYEHWRRIRDSESQEGWVFHSLLSGRRTALVEPWDSKTEKTAQPSEQTNSKNTGEQKNGLIFLYQQPDKNSDIALKIEAGVLLSVAACNGEWCQLRLDRYKGWIQQERLWGVYRGEKIN